MRRLALSLTFPLWLGLTAAVPARPLQVMFWNLESPGHGNDPGRGPSADIDFLARRIEADFAGADVVGFCEVEPEWLLDLEVALERAAGEDYQVVLSPGGGHDRLAIAWKTARFHRLDALRERPPQTVEAIGGPFPAADGGEQRFRPSIYVRLQEVKGAQNLVFCVNHLARSNPAQGPWLRRMQARLLRDWMTRQDTPVLAVGDFNFDYDIHAGDKDRSGYSVLTENDQVRWVRYPDPLVPTQGECVEGRPVFRYQSVLDFVFVANQALQWPARSQVLVRDDDFCPAELNSDHRPIRAQFELPDPEE